MVHRRRRAQVGALCEEPPRLALKKRLGDPDVVAVVANDLARLHRKGWRVGDLLDLLDEHGVHLVLAAPGREIDTSDPTDRLLLTFMAMQDEAYAADIAQRAKDSIAYRKAQGKTVGMPPFGSVRAAHPYPLARLLFCAQCERNARKQDNPRLRARLSGVDQYGKLRYRHAEGVRCGCRNRSVYKHVIEDDFKRLISLLAIKEDKLPLLLELAAQTGTNGPSAVADDFERQKQAAIAKLRRKVEAGASSSKMATSVARSTSSGARLWSGRLPSGRRARPMRRRRPLSCACAWKCWP